MTEMGNPSDKALPLRLHKDPNLDADYFWDMRKPRLPFFRALQFTKNLIPISGDETKPPRKAGCCREDFLLSRAPSKFEIKKSIERNPHSIKLSFGNTENFSALPSYQQLVSPQDSIHIHVSFLRHLFGSCGLEESSDDQWFRMDKRITPQYAILYKVRGITCTCKRGPHDPDHVPIIADVLEHLQETKHQRPLLRPLLPVGRLDLESEGLMLLTNDGSFSRFCTSPAVGLRKVYRVFVKCKGRRKWNSRHTPPIDELSKRLREITDTIHVLETNGGSDDNSKKSSDKTKSTLTATQQPTSSNAVTALGFRAESCTIVDYSVVPWVADNKNRTGWTTHATCLQALMDIEMREGAKREVRRLMRAIGFVTHMLARTTIGDIQWDNDNNNTGGHTFRIPQTLAEAVTKHEAYEQSREASTERGNSLGLALDNALHPPAFRYLDEREVDSIFASPLGG